MNMRKRFIVIDDDPLNNNICRLTIKKVLGEVEVLTFTDPAAGFEHIGTEYKGDKEDTPAILFLDLNMPVMSGWEFMERFEELAPDIKDRIKVYILSSSVDTRDIEKANGNRNVVNYLAKPITKDVLHAIAQY